METNCLACHRSLRCAEPIEAVDVCAVYANNCSACVLEGSQEKHDLVELNATLARQFCSSFIAQVHCLRTEACKVDKQLFSGETFAKAASKFCTNETIALLMLCRQLDGTSETIEEECLRFCDQMKEDLEPMLSDGECIGVERKFCRRPGRGRSCTDRCRKGPRGSCVS